MYIHRLTGEITLLLFLFVSCTKEVSYYQEKVPEGNIVMKNLTPQRVSDNLILEIVGIDDDRCPVGVVCSSGGEVDIEFKAYINSEYFPLKMCFDDSYNSTGCSTTFEGHVIEIIKVSPFPYTTDVININNYSVVVTVRKL
ncbi:MAG: hypothetical protein ACERKD_22605 [Prolixibacteraceae bacterium]